MKNVTPYLIFNGNCNEAINFYKTNIGGEAFTMTYGQADKDKCPAGAENKLMHASLKQGDFSLMASDTPDNDAKIGDNVQLYLSCSNREEVDRLFEALSTKGQKKMPCSDTFWGAYFGMLVDQFGIHWMLGYDLPQK